MKKQLKIIPKIRFLEDSILIDKKILVFSDIHLGYEQTIENQGLIPRFQYKETIEKLERIFKILKKERVLIEKIIILGDLKHGFSENSNSEWRETLNLLDHLKKRTKELIIIRGNHDNYLINILKKRKEIKFLEEYSYKEFCFFHGDSLNKSFNQKAKVLVIGHLHPAISLSDNYKKEKYKCFLIGKWKNKVYLILPSFIPISLGYDLNNILFENGFTNKFFDINNKELKKFEVIIYNEKEDKEYDFGKLGRLIK